MNINIYCKCFFRSLFLLFLCFGVSQSNVLDLASSAYQEGEFEQGIATLENALAQKSLNTQNDSARAFKLLGVMLAANPNSLEKGRYYFREFLKINPEGNIFDLYVSDKIRSEFELVKKEFQMTMKPQIGGPSSESATGQDQNKELNKTDKNTPWLWYAGGSAAVALIAVTTYMLTSSDPESQPIKIDTRLSNEK